MIDFALWLHHVASFTIAVCFIGFLLGVLFRKRPPAGSSSRRGWLSLIGIILQLFSYFLACLPFRFPNPYVPDLLLNELFVGGAIVLAIGSLVLFLASIRTLGKQWSGVARVMADHTLVTDGPYGYVRHPIYTSMLGMLLADNYTYGSAVMIFPALGVFFVGTFIRIYSEEKLLRQTFGQEYQEYANRVRGLLIPRP